MEQKINEVLTRGVENIYPSKEEFEKVLVSGKKLEFIWVLTQQVGCI